jgi:membrane-bound metal-dependent hydrolase YbcI (DUF457 family)
LTNPIRFVNKIFLANNGQKPHNKKMTSRTHDLAAFTALSSVFVITPLVQMSLATLFVSIFANMIGGLIPDLDNHSSEIWDKIRGGSFVSALITPLFGGHRLFSHSLLGTIFFGYISHLFLSAISHILVVDMNVVWWAFMIGFISHLLMDGITKEGIPLLFPIHINFGFPPLRLLRFRTGSIGENILVFPSLVFFNAYLFYNHYDKFLTFLRNFIK